MNNRLRARKQRSASLNTWLWWVPVLAAPFAVAMAEVYISTQMRLNDYATGEMNAEIRQLEQEIEGLRVERARLERLDRLEDAAPNLGLVVPAPSQLRTIYYDATSDTVLTPDSMPGLQYAAAPATPEPLPLVPVPEGQSSSAPGEAMPALDYGNKGIVAPPERHATMPAASSDEGSRPAEPLDESVEHLLGVL